MPSPEKQPPTGHQQQHQANERTYLAWLRTSLALIGFGFAIARFGLLIRQLETAVTPSDPTGSNWVNSEVLGIGMVVVGIVILLTSAWDYNRVYWQIEQGGYRPNRWLVFLMTGIVAILGILSIPLILWRETGSSRSNLSSRLQPPVPLVHAKLYGQIVKLGAVPLRSRRDSRS
ncbi:DUF202 domain-containing protein [Synechococcales cyanobacterium C]|uniref:DUF202 domain-containing protein n=1 Tax=Petrachloros mirabilis ULC683 TaxID=2781853 RepID=A0A8K2A058_9CYAN|nr:DUF202 domain-containing protein [Petrachloros mirabilis]NCJ07178.1 DUF202 domain-containing protein [Petrachloros mirabilis ULC683]